MADRTIVYVDGTCFASYEIISVSPLFAVQLSGELF